MRRRVSATAKPNAAHFALARLEREHVVTFCKIFQHRVGGRIYTMRDPFSRGLYGEAGAMRIPRAHDLTLAYCDLFDLELQPFVMGNPHGLAYIGGVRMNMAEAQAQLHRLLLHCPGR